ncbi:MAG: MBL fold metallo-hydrolase [Filimonas sp.]|nr:MBL fold metallo-hydrolase [Filimonas sp.]
MSLYITSLNSGSNGNCYYIGNETEAVLIDAGISCRETEKRMKRSGLSIDKIKAIFISHEHGDHITGVPGLSKKYQIPVYITDNTFQASNIPLEDNLRLTFNIKDSITIGGLTVTAFAKAHDAAEPHSFSVSSQDVTIGIFTDIGAVCDGLTAHFQKCHAAFLEANYDDTMLMKGNYPYHLKKRISGGKGHLSNAQALQLFIAHRPSFMQLLILSHLSKNNNSPALVQELFNAHAGNTEIVVASRYEESKVFFVTNKPVVKRQSAQVVLSGQQISLF